MKSEYDFSRASVGKFYREGASVRLPDGGSDQRPDDRRTPQFDKLLALLKELFQLDRPDLDFGFYRIMHAKSAEITKFLEQDLLPQVRDALSQYQSADRAVLERELTDALRSAEVLGVNPDDSTTVKDLRARLDHAVDVNTLEAEVYDHLYGFFRRYYSDGDFISKRVYKPGVYAIPYEGEEVKLHWANADQYYIKTDEYLRDYAFRLQPANDADPMRVHFRLADATEGEHGNIKEATVQKRVFVLRNRDFLSEEKGERGDELVIWFEYRPATLADWPEDRRAHQRKPPTQKDLLRLAEVRLLQASGPGLVRWTKALAAPHVSATGEPTGNSRCGTHLDRYTARNTFDYFIHKNLDGFLRRELDFYIKNEVMRLDDIDNWAALAVEQYFSKIKAIRHIGSKIIKFLAQLEDFQKRLWLKKKFVVETSYCVRLDCVPKKYWPNVMANHAQRHEWTTLLSHDGHDRDSTGIDFNGSEALGDHPGLLVDTCHYDSQFRDQLLSEFQNIDKLVDGILIHGDNWQALRMLDHKYGRSIKHVYIDPPYNTDATAIPYKNDYKHSSWLSLLDSRLRLCAGLLEDDGILVVAIDENEQERLGLLLNDLFPSRARTCVTVVHNPGGIQGDNFSYNNEFAYFIYPAKSRSIGLWNREEDPDIRPLRDVSTGQHMRTDARNCFYPILVRENEVVGFGDVCDDDYHPEAANVVGADGTIEVYPIDARGNERKWVFSRQTVESIKGELAPKWNTSRKIVDIIRRKTMFNYKTVWTDKRYNANSYGSKLLRDILGKHSASFMFPKSLHTVSDCIGAATDSGTEDHQVVLDFFAGSGTTAHAVMKLNREDGGRRKFVLVEMGDYFDSVLVPRIKKISIAPEWKGGSPKRDATPAENERSPRVIKVVRIESYEDAIGNLRTRRGSTADRSALDLFSQGDSGEARERYLLNYMLDVESQGSASLLNISAFRDPTSYRLKVKRPGMDESREVTVDLLETFNWLVGLAVHRMTAPRSYSADTERDAEGRMQLVGGLSEQDDGPWWFRTVTGTTPDGRRVLVIWRKRPGGESPDGIERDNLVLDEWFKLERSFRDDGAYDLIYVNGSNNLENLKSPSDTWTVRLIEDDFHRLMWEQ